MVETLGRAYGELTREGWIELLRKSSQLSFSSDVSGRTSVEPRWQIEMKLAAKEGRTIQMRRNEDPSFYVMGMPIKVRENVIGVISGEKSIEDGDWTAEETEFFEEIADMLSVALESARAFQETQLKAERERIASEVTTRIRESLDTESVIKTASDVIRKALGLPEVVIRLSMLDQETTDGGSSHDDG